MNDQLIQKYSVPVPRYTSYPPANFFHEGFTSDQYQQIVQASNEENPQHISIYMHIPFCFRLCHYCGCNAQLFQGREYTEQYIRALKKEISLLLPLLDRKRKISQIHYGGGTPSALPAHLLKELNNLFLNEFDTIENPEIAIECHPGYLDEKHWHELIDVGFNRISIGVQDFNEEVLEASNRKPPRLPLEQVVDILRERQIPINMDFIYGLPLQTVDSFKETMEKVLTIHPDRVVTFSYAHVPWVNEKQKILEKIGLPPTTEKNEMYRVAANILTEAGYETVGLDHFVLSTDELHEASRNKKLHRNFQGYCTRRTTGQVYAFGITGISQLANSYIQNTKDIATYIRQLEQNELPVFKGYELSREQRITREVITELMCNYQINWQEIADRFRITADEVKGSIRYHLQALNGFAEDGLIAFDDHQLHMLPGAHPFVRNVAASFDKLLTSDSGKRFSKAL